MVSLGCNPILNKGRTVLGFGKLIHLINVFPPRIESYFYTCNFLSHKAAIYLVSGFIGFLQAVWDTRRHSVYKMPTLKKFERIKILKDFVTIKSL